MNKSCEECGSQLVDKSHTQTKKYCNQKCLMRAWRRKNPQNRVYEATYFQNNKPKLQSKRTERHRLRYKTDVQYRLKDILRSRLLKALKKNLKSGSAVANLGCSVNELKQYLECKFLPGMTWDNQGKGKDKWNIDHVIPLKSFDLTNPEELKKACHYTNLQPIWEPDHYKKTAEE